MHWPANNSSSLRTVAVCRNPIVRHRATGRRGRIFGWPYEGLSSASHEAFVIDLTGGSIDSAGQERFMATPSMGPGSALPPSEWHASAHGYTRSQMMACLRAGVIALVLLGILALIVLF